MDFACPYGCTTTGTKTNPPPRPVCTGCGGVIGLFGRHGCTCHPAHAKTGKLVAVVPEVEATRLKGDLEGKRTIRICGACGCVHDFPDAGCPQSGEKGHRVVEVVPRSRLSEVEAKRGAAKQRVEEVAEWGAQLAAKEKGRADNLQAQLEALVGDEAVEAAARVLWGPDESKRPPNLSVLKEAREVLDAALAAAQQAVSDDQPSNTEAVSAAPKGAEQ